MKKLTNQSIIVWTLKTKSLLPSLYKREEFPLFGRRPIGASGPEGKEGLGEIFTTICLFNYGFLSKPVCLILQFLSHVIREVCFKGSPGFS
jgi:hypothetical protein